DDGERPAGSEIGDQARDIILEHFAVLDAAFAGDEFARRRDLAELQDLLAIEGAAPEHDLEAVIVRRIVRAGDLDAGIGLELVHGEIEHRRRAEPDAQHLEAAGAEPADQRLLERRRAQPTVIADGDAAAALLAKNGAEGPADGARVPLAQRLADHAAHVELAKRGGIQPESLA